MKTSAAGRALIEEFEGLILGAYDDANDHIVQPGQSVHGVLTIGYGHTDAAGPPHVYIGMEITKDEADAILASDLTSVELSVTHLVKGTLTQNQFDALVSFQFNTGGLGRSSALRDINAGQMEAAADALLLWDRAGGRVLAGLQRRRAAERALFLKPDET